ncbi:MAG: hypothetical protein R3F37_15375 [Candidatus Competibacteraceae bacterium]
MHQSPVQLKLGEYEVQDTRIAVYDTGAGLTPSRCAPSRPTADRVAAGGYGAAFVWIGLGYVRLQYGQRRNRNNLSDPQLATTQLRRAGRVRCLATIRKFQYLSTPYYAVRTDISPKIRPLIKTGLLTFDFAKEEFEMQDFEDTSVVIFSSVVSPAQPNEVFMVYTQLTKMDRRKIR